MGVLALPFFTPGSPVSIVPVAMEQSQQVVISGSIDGLHQGVAAGLNLTLRSGADIATDVSSITVRVTGASAGCSADALSVGAWAGRLVVPAQGEAHAVVPVTLHDASGSCADATWQLTYTSA